MHPQDWRCMQQVQHVLIKTHTHTQQKTPQSISIPNSTIQIKIKSTKTFKKHWQHQLNTQTIQTRNKTYSNLEQAGKPTVTTPCAGLPSQHDHEKPKELLRPVTVAKRTKGSNR